MTPFTFPTPGERRNASAIPVPEPELRSLLLMAARGIDEYFELHGNDELYDDSVDRWRTVQAEALGHETIQLLRVMEVAGVPWPGSRG